MKRSTPTSSPRVGSKPNKQTAGYRAAIQQQGAATRAAASLPLRANAKAGKIAPADPPLSAKALRLPKSAPAGKQTDMTPRAKTPPRRFIVKES